MIEVKNLTKKYGSNTAVDHLNFTIEKGQIYGFLGPNGAGKSTTMNMITGYLASTEGTVSIDGHDILKEPEAAKKCIGYLPEMPPLYQDMTVKEYLDFAADIKKLTKVDKSHMIGEVMDLTKVSDMRNRLIKNLSKGYRQRVGLAQALLGYPDVIILDEPTVGLDPKQIIEIRDLIRSLKSDHTIILSSHILQEISAVCDHIMVISHGKLVASDTAENLSQSMNGTCTMDLIIKGSPAEAKAGFADIKGIRSISSAQGKEDGTADVSVKYDASADLRETIFRKFAEIDMPILEMRSENLSLEDIYLKLTNDTGKADVSESAEKNEKEVKES